MDAAAYFREAKRLQKEYEGQYRSELSSRQGAPRRVRFVRETLASGCILFRLSSVKDAALVKEWLFARHSATAGQALAPRTKQATSALPRRALCHFGAILAPKRD